MRAFLNDMQGLGAEHSTVTKDYKTVSAMLRYAIVPFIKTHNGKCRAEIFHNWDNRYGKPDEVWVYRQ